MKRPEPSTPSTASRISAFMKGCDKGTRRTPLLLAATEIDRAPGARRLQRRFDHAHRVVAGDTIGERGLAGFHRFQEGAPFGMQRFCGREFKLMHLALEGIDHAAGLWNVMVAQGPHLV